MGIKLKDENENVRTGSRNPNSKGKSISYKTNANKTKAPKFRTQHQLDTYVQKMWHPLGLRYQKRKDSSTIKDNISSRTQEFQALITDRKRKKITTKAKYNTKRRAK